MAKLTDLKNALRAEANPPKADFLPRFFKTAPGQYGAGDKFLGVNVPTQRAVAKQFKDLTLSDTPKLLQSPWHEERQTALFILVLKYQSGGEQTRQKIYDLYRANTKFVNNWDLVDCSAPYIMGTHLFDKDRGVLYSLAKSDDLWQKRIAIIATQYFIRQGQYADTLKIAEILVKDSHDLIHKAVGWMLREVGNRDLETEETFLKKHAANMPRTMLRYAIEKFPPDKRQKYMAAKPNE